MEIHFHESFFITNIILLSIQINKFINFQSADPIV